MNHINTVFYQLLRFIPKHRFDGAVTRHQGDYRVRHLNCWSQFIALLYTSYRVANRCDTLSQRSIATVIITTISALKKSVVQHWPMPTKNAHWVFIKSYFFHC
jgi:hypothetical protein